MLASDRHEGAGEGEEIAAAPVRTPVHPARRVVLTVGVVVSLLRARDLVPGAEHGDPLGEQQGGQEVARLSLAEREDLRVVGGSFHPAVPAQILLRAVAVVLAVRLVVLLVVAHEVVQGEAVVGGHEVDARVGAAPAAPVEVAAAGEAVAEGPRLPRVPPPEPPGGVAVLAVPLRPQDREVPDLIPAGAEVPRLGDQLHRGDHGVLVDHVEEGAEPVDVVELAGEGGCQVEAEAVHVHLEDPVAQAVHDELEDAGMGHVERVPAPRVVHVVAPLVGHQPVVGRVVDAPEREGGSEVVALGGVVVDHVEDHLDPGGVEGLDHRLELGDLLAPVPRRRVSRVGGEEADGVVPPVVDEPPVDEVLVGHGLVHGHQLDGGDAERPEVVDHGAAAEAGEGSTQARGDVGVLRGEALRVHLVDHGLAPRRPRQAIVAPGERRVDDHALGHPGRAVPVVPGEVRLGGADHVSEQGVAPVQGTVQGPRIGVEEQLPRVEAMPGVGVIGAVDAIPVPLAGTGLGEVDVPDLVGLLRDGDGRRLGAVLVEQAELHRGGVLGEQREVHPCAVPRRAQRIGRAGSGPHDVGFPHQPHGSRGPGPPGTLSPRPVRARRGPSGWPPRRGRAGRRGGRDRRGRARRRGRAGRAARPAPARPGLPSPRVPRSWSGS